MATRLLVLLAAVTTLAAAEPPAVTDPVDRQILEAFLGHVEGSASYCTPERMARFAQQPEDIVWQASRYIELPLVAYELTEKAQYLDQFVQRMDTLVACATKGPDGFLGWYGLPLNLFRHPEHPDRKVDVILTSFEVTALIADFARIVQADAGLKAKHGATVRRYLDLAENHLVKKWDARGCYRDLGDRGAVYTTHPDLKPVKASLTQPHNKHSKIIAALIGLHAATRKDTYLVKAIKLGTRFKRCLTLVDDRYRWNYWDPAGAWDVHPDDAGKWKHWIGAEHRGGYYALTLSQAVLLHDHGLLFDRADTDRFLKTQTTVCWNGDLKSPRWARVDGKTMGQTYLCSALAPFDDKVRQMAFGPSAQQARLKGRTHSWQGSVVACGWLKAKLVDLPRRRETLAFDRAFVDRFLAEPPNRALLARLTFEVKASGYKPPLSPAQMKPMPGARR